MPRAAATDASANLALTDAAARQLTNVTKSTAQLDTITPRWLTQMLQWVPVEAGSYRLNRVKDPASVASARPAGGQSELPTTHVGYYETPREYFLDTVATVLDIPTRISDLYSSPFDQVAEQVRLTIETAKERQESELINNADYGLLASTEVDQRISTLAGPPTPDDFDQLITKVWKEPAFFLAHPLAIAAFGRECTVRGVPPATVSIHGSQFLTWRGLPIVPSDKVPVRRGRSKVLLLRVGERRQGVIGLYQPGLTGEHSPGLSVRYMGIGRNAVASYLVSLYCSLAVLTPDALAVLDDVEIGKFHDYSPNYR
ncbi:MAG: family 2A encapsulin nanocompartment shell protein [Acidimicrobiales bacterium]